MRSRTLVIIGVVAVVIFLGIPMVGYASMKTPGMSVNINVTARCASATSVNAASYTCSFVPDQGGKPSFFTYVGTFWGSLMHTGSITINYPAVSIVILNMVTGDRIVEDQYFDYTWGQVWSHSFKVDANAGQRVHVQVEIYAAQGMSMGYKTFDYTVPSL